MGLSKSDLNVEVTVLQRLMSYSLLCGRQEIIWD